MKNLTRSTGVFAATLAVLAIAWGLLPTAATVSASDHDDGENSVKARALNFTDLHVFREDWQTGNAGDQGDLILIMSTNPRSLPQQQYYFDTEATYEFHLSRVGTDPAVQNDSPQEDVTLRFTFGAPDNTDTQTFTMTAVLDGQTLTDTGRTTPLGTANRNESLSLGSTNVTVFAGLKEDPFFFDVQQFFKVRGGVAAGFLPVAQAEDFAEDYNVNAIVVRVPISFLAGTSGADVFDIWETIELPGGTGTFNVND